MDNTNILELWKAYDKKLEASISFNRKNAADILKIKAGTLLSSMKPIKVFIIVVGMAWVIFGTYILSHLIINASGKASPFFLVSAGLQVALTAIALILYIYQLVLISQVEVNEPVIAVQKRIAGLKASTLWVTRILFLQFPLWTTFYLSKPMLLNAGLVPLIIQGMVTISFTVAALWFFFNIKFENRNKKWFRLIFEGKEWTPLIKSMEMMDQVEEYQGNYK